MSYFAAALARTPAGWTAEELDLDGVSDVDEVADRVLTITLDRPERLNAFTTTMGRELIEAFDRADSDDDTESTGRPSLSRAQCL